MLRRFDLLVGTDTVTHDLDGFGIASKVYRLRHLVDIDQYFRPLTPAQLEQKKRVDELADRHEHVLMQFNRLSDFKNPSLLLDVAEELPGCGFVFAGDGLERPALEKRVAASASLRGRVVFLGLVPATGIGHVASRISAFVMTSLIGNYNTSFCEMMGLGIAPIVSVDCGDFLPEIVERDLVVRTSRDPRAMALAIQELLADRERRRRVAVAARTYVESVHAPERMWAYRERLLSIVEQYRRDNVAGPTSEADDRARSTSMVKATP